MADLLGSLRTEIVESQKARIDLLKWKIILIAALGGGGFGIAKEQGSAFPVLLGFIPLVCAYVDIVCVHNDLRMLLIAYFLRTGGATGVPLDKDAKAYEDLCEDQRWTFFLESFALVGTTVAFSLLVAVMALQPDMREMLPQGKSPLLTGPVRVFLLVASAIGLVVSVFAVLYKQYRLCRLPWPKPRRGGTLQGSAASR